MCWPVAEKHPTSLPLSQLHRRVTGISTGLQRLARRVRRRLGRSYTSNNLKCNEKKASGDTSAFKIFGFPTLISYMFQTGDLTGITQVIFCNLNALLIGNTLIFLIWLGELAKFTMRTVKPRFKRVKVPDGLFLFHKTSI